MKGGVLYFLPLILALVAVLSCIVGVCCAWMGLQVGRLTRRKILGIALFWLAGLAVLGWYDIKTILGLGYEGWCYSYTLIKSYSDRCPIEAWQRTRWFPSVKFSYPETQSLRMWGLPDSFDIWSMRAVAFVTFTLTFVTLARRWKTSVSK